MNQHRGGCDKYPILEELMAVIVITYKEINEITGKMEEWVSHGVDIHTLDNVALEPTKLSEYIRRNLVRKDSPLGEWGVYFSGEISLSCR